MSKWIIEDWMSRHVYTEHEFDSFEEARDFISEVATEQCYELVGDNPDTPAWEQMYDGICEDLYATKKEDFYNEQ